VISLPSQSSSEKVNLDQTIMSGVRTINDHRGLTSIFSHKALRLELLNGYFRPVWEEQNIPIFISHLGGVLFIQ
jgi:hypothetical protein